MDNTPVGFSAEKTLGRYKVNNKLPKELELIDVALLKRVWDVLMMCQTIATLDGVLCYMYDKARFIRIAADLNRIGKNAIWYTHAELQTILFAMSCFPTLYDKTSFEFHPSIQDIVAEMKRIQINLARFFGDAVKNGIFTHPLLSQCVVDDEVKFRQAVYQIGQFNGYPKPTEELHQGLHKPEPVHENNDSTVASFLFKPRMLILHVTAISLFTMLILNQVLKLNI